MDGSEGIGGVRKARVLAVAGTLGLALIYPWLLTAFHSDYRSGDVVSAFWLMLAFAVPLTCLVLAQRASPDGASRRLTFAGVTVPPLFVLTGVAPGLLGVTLPEYSIWAGLWLAFGLLALLPGGAGAAALRHTGARLRVVHQVAACFILLFVLFHLGNHLGGLLGPDLHAWVMEAGRVVYRSRLVEPLLVAVLLLQVATGLRLAWQWSAARPDFAGILQLGSGVYLAAFIVTHLNSALIYARWANGIETDWAWASGAPLGLLADPWSIRLVPHYALGVFFVIAHLACGVRCVLLAHGISAPAVRGIWIAGLALGVCLSSAIMAGLCGVRL